MKIFRYLLLFTALSLISPNIISQKYSNDNHIEVDYAFQLYGQTRRYNMNIHKIDKGGVRIDWTIFSYQKWLKGSYHISKKGLCCGDALNFIQPVNGMNEFLKDNETFGLISVSALKELKKSSVFVYNNTIYRLQQKQKMSIGGEALDVFYVIADIDNTKLWIWDNESLPLIIKIENNPLEINFYIEKFRRK